VGHPDRYKCGGIDFEGGIDRSKTIHLSKTFAIVCNNSGQILRLQSGHSRNRAVSIDRNVDSHAHGKKALVFVYLSTVTQSVQTSHFVDIYNSH
jgi:hypothetical protein